MNRAQLVTAVGRRIGDQAAADAALSALCTVVAETVARDERVRIRGFGTFRRVQRPAHRPVPPTYVVRFESGEEFRAAVVARLRA